MSNKRYVVEIQLYMYEDDDSAVIDKAKELANQIAKNDDNRASVSAIVEQPIGIIGNRKVL